MDEPLSGIPIAVVRPEGTDSEQPSVVPDSSLDVLL